LIWILGSSTRDCLCKLNVVSKRNVFETGLFLNPGVSLEEKLRDERLGCNEQVQKRSYREDPEVREFWVSIEREEVCIAGYQVVSFSTKGSSKEMIVFGISNMDGKSLPQGGL
jgi:hypothetical protein